VTPPAGALRVLVVNWQDRENPQAGGAEEHLHEVFGRLAARGHEITLLVSGWRGAERTTRLDGMEVHRAGGRHTFSLAAPWYFRRHLAGNAYDLILEDLNKVPVFTPAWSPTPTALLVHHLFGATAFEEASVPVAGVTWLLERTVPRSFRHRWVVAVSPSTRADLVARGMDPAAIEVICNGVDTERYAPDPGTERFSEPTVLYLGRLKRYKGVDLVLRAFAALEGRTPAHQLLVAGTGDHEGALRALAAQLGIADRVHFLGFVPEEQKRELFRRSWVHVLASPKEGWGITNLEAAGCGTPTVASDAPGLRDSVVHGETGLLVPHGDIAALAGAMGRILADPGLRERMGASARSFALRYSWAEAANAMEAFLTRVVRHPRVG
jgi:glycosyltransferase involved in cell wall biosynthesis